MSGSFREGWVMTCLAEMWVGMWDPRIAELPEPSSPPSLGSSGSLAPDFSKVQFHMDLAPPQPSLLLLPCIWLIWAGSSPSALGCCSWRQDQLQFLKMPNIISSHSFCAASASNIPALGWGCLMFTLACRLSPHLSGNLYYLLTHVWALNLVSENRIIYQP